MKYSKDFSKGIGFDHVGNKAHKVSSVWKLGPHIFKNDGSFIFRVCFLRTKAKTYYFQAYITTGKRCSREG